VAFVKELHPFFKWDCKSREVNLLLQIILEFSGFALNHLLRKALNAFFPELSPKK
jgi:hypothetical protein